MKRKGPFVRTSKGVVINLDQHERDVITQLAGELRSLVLHSSLPGVGDDRASDTAHVRRLFPPAYHLDADRAHQDEYQQYMADELVASRLAATQHLIDALAATEPITDEQMVAVMQSINSLRLVLGTLIDVSEEQTADSFPDDHPLIGEYHLYEYLGYLLDSAVRSLS